MIRGALMGLSVALPVGPNALLCIERVMRFGLRGGVLSGLGTALAHTGYAALALVGASALLFPALAEVAPFLLGFLGARALLAPPRGERKHDGSSGGLVLSSLGFAFTNPMTLAAFAALFAGSRGATAGLPDGPFVVAGVFLGSATWWMVLSALTSAFGRQLPRRAQDVLTRISGLVLIGLGAGDLVR